MPDLTAQNAIRGAGPTFDAAEVVAIQADIATAFATGALTDGPHVRAFEAEFAARCGTTHGVAANSGTAALELIYRAVGVAGTDVIVPTNTFLATANAIALAGGHPVFADLDPASLCVGAADIERVLTPRTSCVMVVHIAGLICPDIDAIRALCASRGIPLLEDAAHAHGATINGAVAGSLGVGAAFSFYPTKPMTTGEGGMITTNDARLAAAALQYGRHGVDQESRLHVGPGHNFRLPEIAAIIGRHQLRRLDQHLAARRRVAAIYEAAFGGLAGVQTCPVPTGQEHSYYKYFVVLPSVAIRSRVAAALAERGVPTGDVYYPPCHLQPYAQQAYGTRKGDHPRAEDVLPRVLCLPMHAGLSDDDADRVADAFSRIWRDVRSR